MDPRERANKKDKGFPRLPCDKSHPSADLQMLPVTAPPSPHFAGLPCFQELQLFTRQSLSYSFAYMLRKIASVVLLPLVHLFPAGKEEGPALKESRRGDFSTLPDKPGGSSY